MSVRGITLCFIYQVSKEGFSFQTLKNVFKSYFFFFFGL